MRAPAISAVLCGCGLISCQVLFGDDQYEPGPDAGTQLEPDAAGGQGGAASSSRASSTVGSGGIAGGGGTGGGCLTPPGSGGGPSGGCPGGMLKLTFADAAPYCIDRTEVTREKYAAWLASCPVLAGQPQECAWNQSFEPNLALADCDMTHGLAVSPKKPVVCIDWCDARAYCEAVGKRLCGKKGGGANAFADYADPTLSEWQNACTDKGATLYPYGDTYGPTVCVGDDYDGVPDDGSQDDAIDVTTATGCKVGTLMLFDMSGNVWEWENSCNGATGAADSCRHRGGSFWDPGTELRCDTGPPSGTHKRSLLNKNIGVRCCADVYP